MRSILLRNLRTVECARFPFPSVFMKWVDMLKMKLWGEGVVYSIRSVKAHFLVRFSSINWIVEQVQVLCVRLFIEL